MFALPIALLLLPLPSGAPALTSTDAFAAVDAGRFCDASLAFARAHKSGGHGVDLFNAAVAAERAGDFARAADLWQRVSTSGPKAARKDALSAAKRARSREADSRPCIDTEDTEALVRAIHILQARADKLEQSSPTRGDQSAAYELDVGESPVLGPKTAPIKVMVFTDFQCPYCSRANPFLMELVEDPALNGNVAVVFKHFPLSFHKGARPAAKASMAVFDQDPKKFWAFSQLLFDNQRALTSENFSKWAAQLGLDVKRFERDLRQHDAIYDARIEADMKHGQDRARVRGTPSIYVGGWSLRDRSVSGVNAIIKERGLLDAGELDFIRPRTR